MRNRKKRWFLRRMVLGLAVAAVAVPVAQARPDAGGGTGQSDPGVSGGTALTNEIVRARSIVLPNGSVLYDARAAVTNEMVRAADPAPVLYDARAALTNEMVRAADPAPVLYDARAALTNEIVRAATPAPVREPQGITAVKGEFVKSKPLSPVSGGVVVESRPGFDWGDAGIGAGSVFALMLLVAGASLAVRRGGSHSGGTATA